jgi:hypothetical protein
MKAKAPLFQSLPGSSSVPCEAPAPAGARRVLVAERNQIALRPVDLEATVAPERHLLRDWICRRFMARAGQ